MSNVKIFLEVKNVPVYGTAIYSSRNKALRSPKGSLVLGACSNCGFIANTAFDPTLFKGSNLYDFYEDQQGYSPTFMKYMKTIADQMIAKYALKNRNVIEVGCGKGDFLRLLYKNGANSCVGIDPMSDPQRVETNGNNSLKFIRELLKDQHRSIPCDLLCCRHTLEHIEKPYQFMKTVYNVICDNPNANVFFEVPDAYRVIKDIAFWDIYYEHCSYFSEASLLALFNNAGFQHVDVRKVYNDQYLVAEAGVEKKENIQRTYPTNNSENAAVLIDDYTDRFDQLIRHWQETIELRRKTGQKIAIWGSGSKCVAFMSTLGIEDGIDIVVDINPNRHYKYLPISGKVILPPSAIKERHMDFVIVMNGIYEKEIRQMLYEMGVEPEIASL